MLGLGIGINKSGKVPNSIQKLLQQAGVGMALLPYKADGVSKGVNNPFTNPLVDVANAVGKNLLDRLVCIPNYAIIWASGLLNAEPKSITSDYIKVVPGVVYSNKYNSQIMFFDESKNYLGALQSGGGIGKSAGLVTTTFRTPNILEIKFVRLGMRTSANLSIDLNVVTDHQLELGVVATTYEPYKCNNALLTNFAGTTASGYVDKLLPNGNTKTMIKLDGVDDYGILANNPSVDIVGLDEFEITRCFLTASTLNNMSIIGKYFNNGLLTTQIEILILSTGTITFVLGGITQLTTAIVLSTNKLYILKIRRRSGRLILILNNNELFNKPNTTSVVSQPNYIINARSLNTDGTSFNLLANIFDGGTLLTKNPTDWTKLDKATNEAFRGFL